MHRLARVLAWLPARLLGNWRGPSRPDPAAADESEDPQLRIYFDDGDTGKKVVAQRRPYWLVGVHSARRFHLHVENRGRSVAAGSSGTLERLEFLDVHGQWQDQVGFRPLPLQWAEPDLATAVDLHPGSARKLDIARVYQDGTNLQLVSPMLVSDTQREYPPGTYRMTVSVASSTNGRNRVKGRFILKFGGDWDSVRLYEDQRAQPRA